MQDDRNTQLLDWLIVGATGFMCFILLIYLAAEYFYA
jgi:hypothetical protein